MNKRITIIMLVIYWLAIGMATIKSASADELTPEQETRQNIFHGLSVADAVTTIVGVGAGLAEMNPILGVAPEPITVVTFFVARNILHEITTKKLPEQYRDNWLIGSIVLQAGAVVNNLMILGGL
jgi:hypothetical protein